MKKIYKVAAIATPVTIAASSIGIYLAVAMNDNEVKVTKHYDQADGSAFSVDSIYDHYKVFPEIKQEDFYDQIKVAKGFGIIDDTMVAKIANYVFDHMEVAQGNVGYEFKRKSDKEVILSFK